MQTLALLRAYDVTWPSSTDQALSWADIVNLGVSITAPQCFIGAHYNFYFYYVMQMALPVRSQSDLTGCIPRMCK